MDFIQLPEIAHRRQDHQEQGTSAAEILLDISKNDYHTIQFTYPQTKKRYNSLYPFHYVINKIFNQK